LRRLLRQPEDSVEVQTEYNEIVANFRHETALGQTGYIDCFRNGPSRNRLRVLTGAALQALQQLTGINFIFYYGTTYFQQAGVSDAFLITIITNVVNVVCTVPSFYGFEKFGRRRLLIGGAIVMCFCEYIVAIVGVTVPVTDVAGQNCLIAFVCIYIAAFASTWGPGAWIVTSETMPLAIRAKAMSITTASNWLWNFAIGYATPYLVDDVPGSAGLGSKVFFIWGTTCFCCIVFAYFFIFETKGHSLEHMDLMFESRVKPWRSSKWTPPQKDYWAAEERKASQSQIENTSV